MANRHPNQDPRQSLGELLQRHRADAALSFADASNALNISANALARIESGKLLPSRSLIEAMVMVYRLEAAERVKITRLRFLVLQASPSMPSTEELTLSADAKMAEDLVFLCHSSGDKDRVRELYRQLVSDGVRCWFDEESLLPGQDWDYEIRRAMRESRYVLVCVSNASTTKAGYIQKELKIALDLAEEQPEGRAFIFPVRLEDCELPERLRRWQQVDLFRDGGYERLLRGLGVLRAVPLRPRLAISSNDFNVEVLAAIRELWVNRFGEHVEWIHETGRPDGGVDCLIWPVGEPGRVIAVKTFPSPSFKLTAAVAREALDGVDIPCLMVTRLPLHHGTPGAVSKGSSYQLQFMHWADGGRAEDLEIALRILRDATSGRPHDPIAGMSKAFKNLEVKGSIVPTRDYSGFTGPTLKAGTAVIITDVHSSVFGAIRALSVRDPKSGKHFRNVPWEVFAR